MLTIGQKEWLNNEIMNILGVDESELTNEATFVELGADSLDEVEIVMAVEREYNVQISDEMLLNVKNLGDFYDLVDKVINK